ncbi:MAG: (d)CMP kinase [Bdellovibrionota bacterium]
MNRVIVAIDGFAGTGKTSLSNMLAEKLGFIHLNTGLVYRGTGLLALNTNTALDDEDSLEQMLMSHKWNLS